MQIGEASTASGVSAKMIRYYESIGLVPSANRTDSGYRTYGEPDIHRLRFIHRARELGFSVKRIGDLLRLWNNTGRASREVKKLAIDHIAELDAQIARMQGLRDTLAHLAETCDGDSRPHCPILLDLAGDGDGEATDSASDERDNV